MRAQEAWCVGFAGALLLAASGAAASPAESVTWRAADHLEPHGYAWSSPLDVDPGLDTAIEPGTEIVVVRSAIDGRLLCGAERAESCEAEQGLLLPGPNLCGRGSATCAERTGLQGVAKAVLGALGDGYQHLVVFTTFPQRSRCGLAMSCPVRSDSAGLALPLFDAGELFGSARALQSVIEAEDLDAWRASGALADGALPLLAVLTRQLAEHWSRGLHARFELDAEAPAPIAHTAAAALGPLDLHALGLLRRPDLEIVAPVERPATPSIPRIALVLVAPRAASPAEVSSLAWELDRIRRRWEAHFERQTAGAGALCTRLFDDCSPGSSLALGDVDNDGVPDSTDNCPSIANNGQEDRDLDGLGNACDCDADGDCYADRLRVGAGTCSFSASDTRCSTSLFDCDDLRSDLRPNATERCDGVDNNCNGAADETFTGLGQACDGADPDLCAYGRVVCRADGTAVECVGDTSVVELCGTGVDEDCDGEVDEGFSIGAPCSAGVGACLRTGAVVCGGGAQSCSVTAGNPSTEVCDGADNDCDGQVDEGLGTLSCGLGDCARTAEACVGGVRQTCVPGTPTTELCDGRDNDCDGAIPANEADADRDGVRICGGDCDDTSAARAPGLRESCDGVDNDCDGAIPATEADADGDGVRVCGGDCDDANPVRSPGRAEACDAIDNDCDGAIDELGTLTCGQGVCRVTVQACIAGVPQSCTPLQATPEACDGLDNDCNGQTDDGLGTVSCGVGACARTLNRCVAGAIQVCAPGVASTEQCNGVDDDCDGRIDEDLGTITCGVGPCQRTIAACQAGAVATCVPLAGSAETCNGVDDDCNGQTDDLGQVSCGVGACRRTVTACVAGAQQTCTPGVSVPESCNGLDDDCDGATDDGLGRTTCGVGACQVTAENCAGGVAQACVPRAPQAEVCNGLDDDCDGRTDEDLGQATCGEGACRVTVARCLGGVAQACVPAAAAPETCNGVDDDCNGQIDDLGTTSCGVGACRVTIASCVSGVTQTCTPLAATTEVCNGADDDCDGVTDDGFGTMACGQGACRRTLQVCVGGQLQACDPFTGARAETCNGLDDDCDGATDEDFGLGASCQPPGVCGAGVRECDSLDPRGTLCSTGPRGTRYQGSVETCNGLDDDCDGQVDEELGQVTCGVGVCLKTVAACVGGRPQSCDAAAGANPETCNGLDDDCDGQIDEGLADLTCGAGACRRTVVACAGGRPQTCAPGAPTVELCNGLDDDCDGAVDEDFNLGAPCTPAGICGAGVQECDSLDPARIACSTGPGGTRYQGRLEACNGLDDDCDGQTDEGLGQTSCGVGVCAKTISNCSLGRPQTCDPAAGAGSETCNGLDDDCDGQTDEDLTPLTCGVGACRRTVAACAGGQAQACVPGSAVAEICNGLDDDCDGRADEDFNVGAPCTAPGACGAGVQECGDRDPTRIVCSTGPGGSRYQGRVEVCNGVDDDCDGEVDEGFGTLTCGVGACLKTIQRCSGGATQACDPTSGRGPETCNGVDDDCDGQVDEELTPLTCGRGACQRTAAACVGGRPGACEAGTPSAETCNGLDDDCDGATDEDFSIGLPCTAPGACGTGVFECNPLDARARQCSTGQNGSAYAGRGEICNGLDDDCNGLIDDALPAIRCGLGRCDHVVASCLDGKPQICDELEGRGVEVCDGVDNDCDGQTDEGLERVSCGLGECQHFVACQGPTDGGPGGRLDCDPRRGAVDDPMPGREALCDAKDNDCDGETDEGFGVGSPCPARGECAAGVLECRGDGSSSVCSTQPGGSQYSGQAELCDGRDNDCDGLVDEAADLPPAPTCELTFGVCAGATKTCGPQGYLPCSVERYGAAFEDKESLCDGLDNDCDGRTDAEDDDLEAPPCGKSAGVCEGARMRCGGAAVGFLTCTELDYGGDYEEAGEGQHETRCDGKDNDCNGVIDDLAEERCGVGACSVTLRKPCEGGQRMPCLPTEPTPEICNDVDDDCDGVVDNVKVPGRDALDYCKRKLRGGIEGGGIGCAATPAGGSEAPPPPLALAVLALAALLLGRGAVLRRRAGAVGLALSLTLASPLARAGADVETFAPSPHGGDYFTLQTTQTLQVYRWSAGVQDAFALNTLHLKPSSFDPNPADENLVTQRQRLDLMGSLGLPHKLEAGLVVPLILTNRATLASSAESVRSGIDLGDVVLSAKRQLSDYCSSTLDFAASLAITLPTGDEDALYGAEGPRLHARALLGHPVGPVYVLGNAGLLLRTQEERVADLRLSHELTFDVAGILPLPIRRGRLAEPPVSSEWQVAAQLRANTALSGPFSERADTPIEATVFLRAPLPHGLSVTGGAGTGLVGGYGAADFRVFVALSFSGLESIARDSDGDGVPDAFDTCPCNRDVP